MIQEHMETFKKLLKEQRRDYTNGSLLEYPYLKKKC